MFRTLASVVSPGGSRAVLSILIYHRVLAAQDAILHDEIDAATFEQHARLLAGAFTVMTFGEAAALLAQGRLPARAACMTFDDGYADNETVALPILRRHGLRATFFVAPGYTQGRAMFNDVVIEAVRQAAAGRHDLSALDLGYVVLGDAGSRRNAIDRLIGALKYRAPAERERAAEAVARTLRAPLARDLMMTRRQVRALKAAGMEIGAHTVNHPILASVDDGEARAEIAGSRHVLEEMTDAPVTVFAYPNGRPGRDYLPRHVAMVRDAGYAAAVATTPGVARNGMDLLQLPRFGPWDRSRYRLGARLLLNCVRSRDIPETTTPDGP